jgi:DNA repair exonuclease SbcCD ATPase subunit
VDKEDVHVLLTEIERIVSEKTAATDVKIDSLRNVMLSHFDAFYQRFERLESEYHALSAAVARLEAAFHEDRVDRKDVHRELEELKARVIELQEKIAKLEAEARPS